MNIKVLVAYATTHGATKEVAEAVAGTLREQELTVDVQPARQMRALEGYHAVVLGAPMYMFRLHKDAKSFLARHQAALRAGLPIAIFAGGPFGEPEEKVWTDVRQNLDKELANFPWLKPLTVEVVGGKFDPARLRFPYNLIPAMKSMPASDLRDWDAIRAWAVDLTGKIKAAVESS
jgi:menaquinone-dependent protoporphyrinogen oxidase